MTYDTVIVDSHVILPTGMIDKNIVIDDGKIIGLTNDVPACDHKINGNGLISIPVQLIHMFIMVFILQSMKLQKLNLMQQQSVELQP